VNLQEGNTVRQLTRFNNDWKFRRGIDTDASARTLDIADWETVSLPHDWSIEGPFDARWASATGYLPGGLGWYRKSFTVPDNWLSGKIYIHFDGIYCNSTVWVNGHHVGDRPNGFIPTRYEITNFLLPPGEANVVVVRCDHTHYGDSRWYTGSGINRNVYLVATGLVHVKQWGVFATTTNVTEERANVHVQATVQNHTSTDVDIEIEHALIDPSGEQIASAKVHGKAPTRGEATECVRMVVERPALWGPENPALYTLRTTVFHNGRAVDRKETRIGIRSFSFDPDSGFTLNGRNIKLKGVCIHDDAGALGTAVPVKVWRRRLQILKDCGTNAIRMAHNPHMPELYDLCDEMGFLVQDEAFDEWEGPKSKWISGWNVGEPGRDGYHVHFRDWAETDVADMVLSNRNHPSIIMWSIGNEIDYPNDPYTHEVLSQGTTPQMLGRGYEPSQPHSDRLGVIAKQLVNVVKRHDPSRPVTAALASALISNETGFADALDVVGYNYQEYRYADDHAKYPNRVLYGSENGMLWDHWDAVASNPYICGQFLWTGIDYLGEAHGWPKRSNGAGLMDLAGFPKPEYYYRQSLWSDKPMVYLGTCAVTEAGEKRGLWDQHKAQRRWAPIASDAGDLVHVACFTNCDRVELFVNGRSVGIKTSAEASDGVISWDIPYESGALSAVGMNAASAVAVDRLCTTGTPAKLSAESDSSHLTVDKEEVAHISVSIVDAAGNVVMDDDREVRWTIEGPGQLLGIENGDHASHEDYRAPHHRTFRGRQLGYLRATSPNATIKINVQAPGLDAATILIKTQNA
jgi:beta-galactosidase/beta-glucuronidase